MGRPRKTQTAEKKPAAKKVAPELVEEDGYWWMVKGKEKTNLGRSKRYAEILMQKQSA